MTDQPELTQKNVPSNESTKEDPISSSFGSRPNDGEIKELAFIESAKELNNHIEQPNTEELLRNKTAQKEIIDKVVDKVHHEVSLDAKISIPEDIDAIRADHANMHGDINAEIRETLGENSEVQQLEARVEAWRTRNINKSLDLESKVRQQEAARDKELKNKQNIEQENKESRSNRNIKPPPPLWGIGQNKKAPKSVLDLLIDKILEVLGLKTPEQNVKQSRKGKGAAKDIESKKGDDPILKKLLRLIGIIE